MRLVFMNGVTNIIIEHTDIKIVGYYDGYDILHVNNAFTKSKYLTIDNILEFLKVKDIKFIYEPIFS